jgi:hypothetical protein
MAASYIQFLLKPDLSPGQWQQPGPTRSGKGGFLPPRSPSRLHVCAGPTPTILPSFDPAKRTRPSTLPLRCPMDPECSVFRRSVYSEHRFLERPNTAIIRFFSPRFRRVFGTGRPSIRQSRVTPVADFFRPRRCGPIVSTDDPTRLRLHTRLGRPARTPEKGDVSAALIALRLGIATADFEARRPLRTGRPGGLGSR